MNTPLVVDYYSDVLCVWAWIAQRRIDELNDTLGKQILFKHHYMDIFGDVATKMSTQWQERGGFSGFAEHVQHSASAFEDIPIHPDLWKTLKPTTSANAHMVIKAVELHYGAEKAIEMALSVRKAFFMDARDISHLDLLCELVTELGLERERISRSIQDGSGLAALMGDYQQAKQQGIKGSPSYVLDGGRQTLYGNVGYRVLLANIEELLKKPKQEASWC